MVGSGGGGRELLLLDMGSPLTGLPPPLSAPQVPC